MDARDAVVSDDRVNVEAGCFGLFALVGDRLIGGTDAGVQDRLHGSPFVP
jgi:hypothetical protein